MLTIFVIKRISLNALQKMLRTEGISLQPKDIVVTQIVISSFDYTELIEGLYRIHQ
jgi:hypothetical protein